MLPSCDPYNAAILHVSVTPGIERNLKATSSAFRSTVLPFVIAYWSDIVERQPFRFGVPSLTKADWMAAVQAPADQSARAALRVIVDGLRVRLPDTLTSSREWLEGS
jgi:hypothetical protein